MVSQERGGNYSMEPFPFGIILECILVYLSTPSHVLLRRCVNVCSFKYIGINCDGHINLFVAIFLS
jgi:hypothetical protein